MKNFDELNEELLSEMPELKPSGDTISRGFADVIFSYRIKGGLTQQQLADKSKVGVRTIHRIEGGSGGVTDTTYQKVIEALELDWEEVIEFLAERKKKARKILIGAL